MKMLRLQPIGYRSENQIVSAQLAFDSTIMILETAEIPSRINGMFVPSVTNGLSWRVKLHQEGLWQQVDLYHPFLNFHFVQKIDEQRLLLVAARVKNSLVHNACIYSMEGQLLSEFALDDAIQSVDVTEGGSVWVSYFDEGIFGNGILAPFGFIKTDLKGNVLWTAEKFAICDCYAVNIDR